MSQKSTLQVRCFPAGNGDCLLISYGSVPKKHIIVDFGYVQTYKDWLRPILEQFTEDDILERVVVSHIDADHISGAIAFFADSLSAKLRIGDVWHNTLRHLYSQNIDGQPDESLELKQLRKRILSRGAKLVNEELSQRPISALQGTSVGALLLKQAMPWNQDFEGLAVVKAGAATIELNDDASVVLLSPGNSGLAALKTLWISELKKFKTDMPDYSEGYDDAFELCMIWERKTALAGAKPISSSQSIEGLIKSDLGGDRTATNGSSIAFILAYNSLKLLLLADAHPDVVLESLNQYGEGTLYFDLIKVSHHGSLGNISIQLLDKIDSRRYLFSTDGKRHNHPDIETIAHIIHRKAPFTRQLIFNYKTKSSEYFNREDWQTSYGYTIQYLSGDFSINFNDDLTV